MAYLIRNISGYLPDQHPYYFFDANVWIAALKNTGSKKINDYEKSYVDLLERIIELYAHKGTKQEKKIKCFPKIVVTSLLLSEIVNAYMRNVAMTSYYISLNKDPKNYKYKEHYRSQDDHDKQLSKLVSDFIAFKDYVEIFDDDFKNVDLYSILPSLNSNLDFNDLYYYYLFCKSGIPIVTHDRDFIFQDIEIITAQPVILNLG